MPQTIDQAEPATEKPPVSEKKRAANRANAQKSTGPRTDAGKAASRRNAAKHFMTGRGAVVPDDLDNEINREIAVFAARLRPVDDYDWQLVREAAVGSVRLDRLVQVQEANIALNVQRATQTWDEDREDRVADLARRLLDDPAHAVRMLRRFTEGCDYLWDAWDGLQTRLQRAGFWSQDDTQHALRLLGSPDAPTANDAGPATTLTLCALGAHLHRDDIADEAAAFFDLEPDLALTLLPNPDEALDALLGLIEQHKDDLRTLADRLWDQGDAQDRATARTRALVDLGPEGKRLHRYEQDAIRLRDRALRELNAHRDEPRLPNPPGAIPPAPRPPAPPAQIEPKPISPVTAPPSPLAQNEATPSRVTSAFRDAIATRHSQALPPNPLGDPPT